ncbi:MAG: hypothetical protein IJ779_06140 [Ruminococcus sp.]|nr:hypothetical protein [Ruminococcus sp.]
MMNEFKELDVLENTDESVQERLAEEFPPQDTDEKERVFRMSERKYNIQKNKNNADVSFIGEETVKGVEIYKRPKWKIFASIAACAAIVAGMGGGGYMMKMMKHSEPVPSASEMQSESAIETVQTVAPFGDFSELEYYIPINGKEKAEQIIINDDPSWYSTFGLMTGTPIEQDKRDRLAEFFNSYTWETYTPLGADSEPVQKSVEEPPSFDPYRENIVFFYHDDKEVREIQISRDGVLGYTHFNYVNKDGQLYKDPMGGDIPYELYKVNYEFFKDTIDNILYGVGNVPPMQCDELEVIVKTFEKYDFYIQENTSNDGGINIVSPDGERFSILCGSTLSNDKKDKIDTIIKNASWTNSPADESEVNRSAVSEHFTDNFGFVNITGNDIIAMDISRNSVEMCIYECSYDNGLYYVNEQSPYKMYTDSPTFMTDVYNVLFDDEPSAEVSTEAEAEQVTADFNTMQPEIKVIPDLDCFVFTVILPENAKGRYTVDCISSAPNKRDVFSSPPTLVPEMAAISVPVYPIENTITSDYTVEVNITDLNSGYSRTIGTYTISFSNMTIEKK